VFPAPKSGGHKLAAGLPSPPQQHAALTRVAGCVQAPPARRPPTRDSVIAWAGADLEVVEANEGNNCRASATRITVTP